MAVTSTQLAEDFPLAEDCPAGSREQFEHEIKKLPSMSVCTALDITEDVELLKQLAAEFPSELVRASHCWSCPADRRTQLARFHSLPRFLVLRVVLVG